MKKLTVGVIVEDERGGQVVVSRVFAALDPSACDHAKRHLEEAIARVAKELGEPELGGAG